MPPTSPAQLLDLLKRNSLLSDKHLIRLTRKLDTFESIQDLADYLVKNELLTAWQAKQLLSGKKAPHVGQYRIIEGLAQDEFGKRFVAVHKKLDRTVEVQVLSKKISDEVSENSKQIISQIASLDHPNLVHCLEIDRVKGRFVVIDEHQAGSTLAAADPNQLSESDIAKMVRQCLAGLMYAHARGVFHGELNRTKIVTRSGDYKIRDFAIANLKRVSGEEANEQPESETDLFELAEIGLELLDQIPASESEPRKRLSKIISDLGMVKVDRVADLLDRWIEANRKHQRDPRPESNAVEPETAEFSEPRMESSKAKQESGAKRDPKSAPDSESTPPRRPRKRKSPILAFGGIAAAFVVIFGGLFAYWIVTHPPAFFANLTARADTVDAVEGAIPTGEAAESKDDLPAENQADPQTENPDLTATDDPDQTTVVDPDVSTQPPKPGDEPATDPAENPVDPPKPEENPVDPPKPEEKTVEPPAERPPEVPKVPFREFTKHLELPALDNVQPIEIGKLAIQPSFLLGVNLFLSPEAARKTGIFELRRSDEDKQRWLVSKRKSKNSDPTDVAAFWKSDRAFHFQWLPAAQLDEDVNYLRNGALKLETPDGQNGWLSLRSPVTIEGFQLANEKGSAQVKLEIPWLPSPKGLIYQITPFADRTIPSFCTSEFVQPKAPALMYFTTVQAEAFLWLEVSASQRKAIVLEAELKVKLGAIKPLNPAALSQYRQANLKMAKNAAAMSEAAKDNQTAQQQYAAVQKTATQAAATFAKYEKIIPKLQGKDIPVAIYLNVDKHHQLLIAKSPGFAGF